MLLTISYITSRPIPRFDWFFESLRLQLRPGDDIELVIVDFFAQACDGWTEEDVEQRLVETESQFVASGIGGLLFHVPPKPTVWAGPYRVTKHNWWHASGCRNTALCMANGDWFACVDDRCVLLPGWMTAVRAAMADTYAVVGTYEKRTGITVENGVIKHGGIVTGEDTRLAYVNEHYSIHAHLKNPYSAPGEWFYGCSFALPLEWALRVNGFDETADSSSGEDYLFGLMLQNNGFELRFDLRMAMVEDRSPEAIGTPMLRKDKGTSPADKSHALLAKLRGQRRAHHPWDLRAIRANTLRGAPWPNPDWPVLDWYDNQPVKDFTPP